MVELERTSGILGTVELLEASWAELLEEDLWAISWAELLKELLEELLEELGACLAACWAGLGAGRGLTRCPPSPRQSSSSSWRP